MRLKAVFPNEDGALFPNQFVNARLYWTTSNVERRSSRLAVQRGPQGTFVFVVKGDHTVGVQAITVGVTHGESSVESGVVQGDLVVVDGAEKLRDGTGGRNRTRDSPPPASELPPTVGDEPREAARRPRNSLYSASGSDNPVNGLSSLPDSSRTGCCRYLRLLQVSYPTIQVATFCPVQVRCLMASSVTAPLEQYFGQMPGLTQMTSTSSSGSGSVVTLQFSLDLDLDVAEQGVQAGINAASTFLPGSSSPPVYSKVNPADAPILTLALTSETLPLSEVEEVLRNPVCSENFANVRRGSCDHQRRTATGGSSKPTDDVGSLHGLTLEACASPWPPT